MSFRNWITIFFHVCVHVCMCERGGECRVAFSLFLTRINAPCVVLNYLFYIMVWLPTHFIYGLDKMNLEMTCWFSVTLHLILFLFRDGDTTYAKYNGGPFNFIRDSVSGLAVPDDSVKWSVVLSALFFNQSIGSFLGGFFFLHKMTTFLCCLYCFSLSLEFQLHNWIYLFINITNSCTLEYWQKKSKATNQITLKEIQRNNQKKLENVWCRMPHVAFAIFMYSEQLISDNFSNRKGK